MKKVMVGITLGGVAGVIDVVPMLIQKLTWDANLGAFSMWVICGFFISTTELRINPIIKGVLISMLILTPSAFIIGWQEPTSLIPIFAMTVILGGLLGFTLSKLIKGMKAA